MTDRLRVSQVFVPGRLPEYTYNPRSEMALETHLRDYLEETGSILTVAGPTKTGKSVLLRTVAVESAWVEGQGITNVSVLWERLGDSIGVWTHRETNEENSDSTAGRVGGEVNLGLARVGSDVTGTQGESQGLRFGVDRPMSSVVREELRRRPVPIVVDDFHFIARAVQLDIVRALKPLVLDGLPVVFISISHRVQDVVSAEPDMTGRVESLPVDFWSEDELVVIARLGFEKLNLTDTDLALARRLARESYGSPHLMQKFCRELCKVNGVREAVRSKQELSQPPEWNEFFAAQVDRASTDWFYRLLRGPQERGAGRTQWTLKDGRVLDGYGVTLAAIASTGPDPSISKDRIKSEVESLVQGVAPAPHQTTRVLQHMTKIAAKRASEPLPTEDDLDQESSTLDGPPDTQPVLEYVEQGPTSGLHIADPFFAFFVKWGSNQILDTVGSGGPDA